MTVYDTGEYSGFHACCLNCGPAIGNHIVVGAYFKLGLEPDVCLIRYMLLHYWNRIPPTTGLAVTG